MAYTNYSGQIIFHIYIFIKAALEILEKQLVINISGIFKNETENFILKISS